MHYNFCLKPCTNHFQTTHDILVKPSLDERDFKNSVTASKFILTFTYMSTYYSIQFQFNLFYLHSYTIYVVQRLIYEKLTC